MNGHMTHIHIAHVHACSYTIIHVHVHVHKYIQQKSNRKLRTFPEMDRSVFQ